jgi:hypothetical protein
MYFILHTQSVHKRDPNFLYLGIIIFLRKKMDQVRADKEKKEADSTK